MIVVGVYLAAIVAANLVIATFGPTAAIPVAFMFVGLDLTTRDRLHDLWDGPGLWVRMLLLIAAGGLLSWLVNGAAGPIAVASTVAFAMAAAFDTVVYALLADRRRVVRVNASNGVAAVVDSIVFPTLAFGAFLPLIIVGQIVAKILGGFFWYGVMRAVSQRRATA
jgi:hypothetical protein